MKKVLIVDDNDNILKVLKILLENRGFDVATSDRAADVVSLVQWLKPDVVLMDILMGKSNGFDIYTDLKQNINTRKTPVLLMCTDDIDACITLMHKVGRGYQQAL
jgi:CheY-like chemotaxis protein